MRISDWSSDVCSSDLYTDAVANGWRQYPRAGRREEYRINFSGEWRPAPFLKLNAGITYSGYWAQDDFLPELLEYNGGSIDRYVTQTFDVEYGTTEYGAEAYEAYLRERYVRSEEHTSKLPSLMRSSYAAFCLKKTNI